MITTASKPPSPEQMHTTIAAYFAATRSMDIITWLSTFAEDAISYEPGQLPIQGHTALAQFFQGFVSLFDTVGLQENDVFITSDRVAVKWTGYGVGQNQRSVMFSGIDVFEINSQGRIQRMWGYWNPEQVLLELQLEIVHELPKTA